MEIEVIKQGLESNSIFLAEDELCGKRAVIGYEKTFKWRWFATQMNTFVVVADMGEEELTVEKLESFLEASFAYAKRNYRGWPRGFQSGMAVIVILISENVHPEAGQYCSELKTAKKWAGFSVPVVVDSKSKEVFKFRKDPMWGRIYYPHFRKMIEDLGL